MRWKASYAWEQGKTNETRLIATPVVEKIENHNDKRLQLVNNK